LQAHADQLNTDLVATLHAYANEASKMGEHRMAWDRLAISREVAQCLGNLTLMGNCYFQAGLLQFHRGTLNLLPLFPMMEERAYCTITTA